MSNSNNAVPALRLSLKASGSNHSLKGLSNTTEGVVTELLVVCELSSVSLTVSASRSSSSSSSDELSFSKTRFLFNGFCINGLSSFVCFLFCFIKTPSDNYMQ